MDDLCTALNSLCTALNWLVKVFLQNPGGWAAVGAALTGYKLKDAAMLWLKSRYFIRRAIETEKAYITALNFANAMLELTNPLVMTNEKVEEIYNNRFKKVEPRIEEMYDRSLLARLYLPDDLWKLYEELTNLWPILQSSYHSWQTYNNQLSKEVLASSPDMRNELVRHFTEFCGTETRKKFENLKSEITKLSRPIVNFDPRVMKM
jgi:hypothetical protein